MTTEHYITAGYYIGLCVWLLAFIYVFISAKELAHDNNSETNLFSGTLDVINLFNLIGNGKSKRVRVSAFVHLIIITILVAVPVLYF